MWSSPETLILVLRAVLKARYALLSFLQSTGRSVHSRDSVRYDRQGRGRLQIVWTVTASPGTRNARRSLEQLILVLHAVLEGGDVLVFLQVVHHQREVVGALLGQVEVEGLGVVHVADLLVDVEGQGVGVLGRAWPNVLQLRRHGHVPQQHRDA